MNFLIQHAMAIAVVLGAGGLVLAVKRLVGACRVLTAVQEMAKFEQERLKNYGAVLPETSEEDEDVVAIVLLAEYDLYNFGDRARWATPRREHSQAA